MTEPARSAADLDVELLQEHREDCEGIGDTALWLVAPDTLPFDLAPRGDAEPDQAAVEAIERSDVFHHVPR